MGQYSRNDFSAGWYPSADDFNGPKNGLLRADNLVLDEIGALTLRQGSQKINSVAFYRIAIAFDHTESWETAYMTTYESIAQFTEEWERAYLTPAMPGNGPGDHNHTWEVDQGYIVPVTTTDTDVASLFTQSISGTRYRMAGVTDAVYSNGTGIWGTIAGSGDIAFGAHMGQVLFARSTTKKKWDGTTVRNWGIAAPTAAPTVAAITADSKVFASCASAESPAMTIVGAEGSLAFTTDRASTANAAVELTPSATTGRVAAQKTFAAPTDFTTYTGGQIGTDDDLIDFFNYVTEPQLIDSIAVMIDVNDGTFQLDWYEYTFRQGDAIEVIPDVTDSLASNYTIEGTGRDVILSRFGAQSVDSSYRVDKPVTDAGWNHFTLPRGSMNRHGLTSGQNWSTVKAVRVVVNCISGGATTAVRFDEIQIVGGAARPYTGKYKAAVVFVRDDGNYVAISAPSAFSTEIELKAQGLRVTVPATVIDAMDSQVTDAWLYIMGGRLDAFYRVTTKAVTSLTSGTLVIDATSSEITILAANLRMETDNAIPPDTIIGIEGPHFDRTLCLTAGFIYPSRQLNPDSYSAGEVVRAGDAAEQALWLKKLGRDGLFLGTTADIYELTGDWTVLPDGSINVAKRPLHVSVPPIGNAVTVGNINGVETLIYLSASGWRTPYSGSLTQNAVDLLWRGETRYGVTFANIVDVSARFRCAVSKDVLFAMTPEAPSTTSTVILHAYHFARQRWYRYVYPQAFRSLYMEPDGTLIAGDESGFVRQLDIANKQDDGVDIPVELWTPFDDNGEPFTYKDPEAFHLRLETGLNTATINWHTNGNEVSTGVTTTTSQESTAVLNNDVSTVPSFSQVSLHITGSFSTFVLRAWNLRYIDNPMPQVIHDTGPIDLTADVLKWVRKIRIKAKSAVDLTVQPYWDGEIAETRTANVAVTEFAGQATVFDVPLGREDKGRVARLIITTTEPSHVYWVQFWMNGSGKPIQKMMPTSPEAA